jgi:tetratricopeptide (TPR) repeat protein
MLGNALEETGNHADAQAIISDAIQVANKQRKDNANLHVIACKAYMASGNLSAALEHCIKVEKLASQDAQLLMEFAEALQRSGDPVLSNFACKNFEKAKKLGLKDYRIPALQALASYQMGKQKEGLRLLKEAIAQIPTDKTNAPFVQEMKQKAELFENKMQQRQAAPVAVAQRKYEMKSGTVSVVAERDETTGAIVMGIMGGHDPDGGKQDGCDDGIIEADLHNLTQPSQIYRKN